MSADPATAEVGVVYQIKTEACDTFGGALVIATEVKSWGVQGAIWGPKGVYYVRKKWEDLEYIGVSVYAPADNMDGES